MHDHIDDGLGMLEQASRSRSFQTGILLIDRLKATAALEPEGALKKRLKTASSSSKS